MKSLSLNEMENIEGGASSSSGGISSDCAKDIVGLGLTFAGAFLVTGPIGAGLFAASFIYGAATLDC